MEERDNLQNKQSLQNLQNKPESNTETKATVRQAALQLALQLRLRGARYEFIAAELKETGYIANEGTVRGWFSVGGDCHAVYESERKKRQQERLVALQEADEMLKEGALDAISYLRNMLLTGNYSIESRQAANDILDRAGFPKQTKNEFNGKVESESLTTLAESMREIANEIKK